jgi:hypothetical protein
MDRIQKGVRAKRVLADVSWIYHKKALSRQVTAGLFRNFSF